MIHRYIFYIDGGEIQSFKFDKNKIELIKYKGELACSINDKSFWSWWEKSSSYIGSEDLIDFCFLGNINSDFFQCSYKTIEFSEWKIEDVKLFFNEHIKYNSLKLKYINQEEEQFLQLVKSPTACNYEKDIEFNIFMVPSVLLVNNYNPKGTNTNGNFLREYYLDLLYENVDE